MFAIFPLTVNPTTLKALPPFVIGISPIAKSYSKSLIEEWVNTVQQWSNEIQLPLISAGADNLSSHGAYFRDLFSGTVSLPIE